LLIYISDPSGFYWLQCFNPYSGLLPFYFKDASTVKLRFKPVLLQLSFEFAAFFWPS